MPEEFAVAPLEEKARNNFLPILYLSHLILSFLLFLQFPIVCSVCATTTTRERESGQASGPCNELTGAAGEQPGSRDIKGLYDPRLPDQGPVCLQGDPSGWLKPPVDLDLACSANLPGQ